MVADPPSLPSVPVLAISNQVLFWSEDIETGAARSLQLRNTDQQSCRCRPGWIQHGRTLHCTKVAVEL